MRPAEMPVAEESDKNEHHNRRRKKLTAGDNVPRREQQQSNGRNKGGAREARTAPREDGSYNACTTPHQSQQRYERRGVCGPWPGHQKCNDPGKTCCEKRARKQNCSKRFPLGFHVVSFF
jgi:hypothetical protein